MRSPFYQDIKEELEILIQEKVEAEVAKQLKLKYDFDKLVGAKEACKILKICRQTLFNWEKSYHTKHIIAAYTSIVGKRKQYNIVGLQKAIIEYSVFGKGKDYEYKKETISESEMNLEKKCCDSEMGKGIGWILLE